jgi:ABC-type antimicrobial peptide transport system permease subunit
MKIPLKYTFRSFRAKKLTTAITIIGISLVVFVFAAVLMMAHGVEKTLVATGSPDNLKITRKAANGEISSIIDPETQNVIRTLPNIGKNPDGTQLISNEPVVIINISKGSGELSNVTVRGVGKVATQIRPQVKIVEGRMFTFGLRELIAGESLHKRFPDAQVGSKVKLAGDYWNVVGVFTSSGSGFDSELWGDAIQLLGAFNRGSTFSSITLKLADINRYSDFKRAFDSDRRLQQFEYDTETQYYEKQSAFLATFIRILGIFITVIFSFGATIGAMITMYSAVANRTVEIGTLRSLGFRRRSILGSFLTESLAISLIGGAIGLVLASFLQFFSISTMNFSSFSELAFSFALSPSIIISSLIFALLMGIMGGFLPSVRAARMNIVTALRAG